MAYFDSPKNRAFWQKELEGLKKQRDAYMNGGEEAISPSEQKVQKTMSKGGYLCEEITFDQLSEEVFGKKVEPLYLPPQKTMQKEMQHEM